MLRDLMIRATFAVLFLGTVFQAAAQSDYPPHLKDCDVHVYKEVDGTQLRLWIYVPEGHSARSAPRPAVIFFFGGGWRSGNPAQFESHCRYLASRGIVAATADYRVSSRHNVKAKSCVQDAKSAVRWLRANATSLGIDQRRICAAGGSAGGHIACCSALISGLDAVDEDSRISSVPNAMALFNPAVAIAPLEGFEAGVKDEKLASIRSRTGITPEAISPIHHIRKGLPPTVIFHGRADSTVPFATVEEYARRAKQSGNRCDLHGFAGAPHGFFNAPKGGNPEKRDRSRQWYLRTLLKLDQFLQSLGWVQGKATIPVVDFDHVSLRGNLSNSRHQFTVRKQGHVAFLGGSITEMDGYRPIVCNWLQQEFPDTEFTFTNAGIASTCSNTGAFRLDRDVLSKGPVDLLFVEFAVNDDQDAAHTRQACIHGMEGVVRHVRAHNSRADVIMTHFVNPQMLQALEQGKPILSVSQHEKVAIHYDVSSVNLPQILADRIKQKKMTWKQFGGTHPGPKGNQLAADMVASVATAGWEFSDSDLAPPAVHEMPIPLLMTSFSEGRLLSPESCANEQWTYSVPNWKEIPGNLRGRFENRSLLHASTPGAEAEFEFSGTAVGAFVLAGPDAGRLEVRIDDGDWKTHEVFHRFSNGLHYPRTVLFADKLQDGPHQVRMRISGQSHQNSTGQALRILNFAVNGE